MNQKLIDLTNELELLKDTVDKASFTEAGFDTTHGWNQVHLDQNDISTFIENFIEKLKKYGNKDLTKGLEATIDGHISNINRLNITTQTYFTNAANHLVHMVPSLLLTLLTVFNDIEFELFSWENCQDKKLLPRGLSSRLRSVSSHLDSFDSSCVDLESKIKTINNAHEAAESLPTDLASLNEAKKELELLLKAAKDDVGKYKTEISDIKADVIAFNAQSKKSSEEAEEFRNKSFKSSEKAASLVEQCDDALQITTTQGLAAGFDQKAKELKNSIWVWIIGLLIALSVGAFIGADRVRAFTLALESELTVGQAMLHTIMSIFSIGGPLWLAWISTQQINQRFKLSEDYSYKATVAKAFTGFSKFAERYDEATSERLFNSTLDRLDEMPLRLIEGKDYNSPWHEFIDSDAFKKAIDMVPSLAKEAGRFASNTKLKKKPKINNSVS